MQRVRRDQKNHRVKFAFVEYKSGKNENGRGTNKQLCMRTNTKHETKSNRGSKRGRAAVGERVREKRGGRPRENRKTNVYT